MSSDELKALLIGRADYHLKKVAAYETQLEQFKQMEEELSNAAAEITKVSTVTPAANLRSSLKGHQEKARYYRFAAEHIIPDASYHLRHEDMQLLGLGSLYG
jgi:hypothetical protein